jgi:starch synthase
MELLRVKVASLEGELAQAKASPPREGKQPPQYAWKASSNSTRDNVSDRASDRISDRDHESVKSTTDGAPTEGQTDIEIASLNGSASPTYCHNIPEYMTPPSSSRTPDMIRASSLSCFDRLVDTEGLAELRGKMDEIRQEECPEERPVRYGARHLNTPIVIVSSEMHPWSKTGGLAMVVSSYAYEFAMRGHRTMAIAPRYADYKGMEVVGSSKIWLDGEEHEVRYYYTQKVYGNGKACDYVFVDHPCFHRSAGLYGDPKQGGEYQDNLFRFSLLSIAALEAPLLLNVGGSTYGQEVCFIANDWQTGLLPLYFHYKYKVNSTYRHARVMMTLHNMGYQGRYRMSKFPIDRFLGLPREAERELQCEDCHYGRDCMNLLGAGIRMADRVLTVSPTYAKEIQTAVGGLGLDHALREKCGQQRLEGILNGISDEWSPMTDPYIPMQYSKTNFQEGKSVCKAALQRELGLRVDASACLVGFCGRLCFQKGIHMINEIIPWLMTDTGNGVNGRIQLILMGKGDMGFERQVSAAEAAFKGRVCGYVGFDPEVEHRMMAGCDLLLMPSQYEPCGLPQMYAQQYATLPVVHETGGLKDSVKGMWDGIRDRNSATGFLFSGFDVNRLKERMYQAMDVFHHKKDLFRQMQQNAISSDYYWPQAIDQYEKHIDATMEAPSWRR